ncbi:hypothetical protein FWC63_02930 [Candidatus Saccharibacteria bacterium]|nr:hypothetical protein [Candidatus Saccharibacteria bacterium]
MDHRRSAHSTHPLVKLKLEKLLRTNISEKEKRELATEITIMLGYEATHEMKGLGYMTKSPAIVPIIPGGPEMASGLQLIMPYAKVGHFIASYDEGEPKECYCKLPQRLGERETYLLCSELRTGATAIEALAALYSHGAQTVKLICLTATKEGVEVVRMARPDLAIFAGMIVA